jgi:hypothetical protein
MATTTRAVENNTDAEVSENEDIVSASNGGEQNDLSASLPPKRKRGRPRSFAAGTTTNICVNIETRQKELLEKITAGSPQENASKIVREALDLWFAAHAEGNADSKDTRESESFGGSSDDYDYGWH